MRVCEKVFGVCFILILLSTSSVKAGDGDMMILLAGNGLSISGNQAENVHSEFSLSISAPAKHEAETFSGIDGYPEHFNSFNNNLRTPNLKDICSKIEHYEDNLKCQNSVVKFSGIAEIPLEEGFSIFGKLGLQYFQNDGVKDIDLLRLNLNQLGAVLKFGLKYEIRKDWYLSAESEGFGDSNLNWIGIGAGIKLAEPRHSIGLSFRF